MDERAWKNAVELFDRGPKDRLYTVLSPAEMLNNKLKEAGEKVQSFQAPTDGIHLARS
jgi:hypothetical protein